MGDDPRVEEAATLEPEGGELAEWADALEANAQDMRDGFEASEPDIRNAASAIRAHRCQPDDPAPWAVAERERNDGQIALIRIARAAETSINWYAPDPAGQVADAVRRLAAAPPPADSDVTVDRDALVRAFMAAERVHSDRWRYLPERADRAEAEAMADVALAEIERQRGEQR